MWTFNLDRVLNPKTVAVIGASDQPGTVGFSLSKNFLKGGFEGAVHLVNVRDHTILGQKTVPSIGDVPVAVDLALIATPAATVPDIVE